ncbi:MAG: hemerythrin domain-containing protein, partial [Nitrospirota bacterium]
MAEKILKVTYQCLHSSCVVNCRNGELFLPEALLEESFSEDKTIFKSPRDFCRLGYSQPFKVMNIEEAKDADAEDDIQEDDSKTTVDPIAALKDEHNKVLKKVEAVEAHLDERDIEGLWISTCDLDNILHLHGAIKEEDVLFPALLGLVPFGEGLVACINEDHREIVSLVHSFREALTDGNINDKVIGSAIVALRSHIRKEDNEFYEFIKKYINNEMKKAIMAGMEQAEKAFIPKEPGERKLDEKKAAERAVHHGKL